MNPLFPTPGAGFDDPIEILDGCHQRIRRQCAMIEKIAAHLERHGPDAEARQACLGVIRYFTDAGAKHHRDEEEDLFPALEQDAPEAEGARLAELLAALRNDHVALDERWAAMRVRLAAVSEGTERRIGADIAAAFTAAYERHIALEERELLPLARRILGRPAVARLGRAMAHRRGVPFPQ